MKEHLKLEKSCSNIAQSIKDLAITDEANLSVTSSLPISPKNSSHLRAVERCQAPKSSEEMMYFCVEIEKDLSSPKGSFLNGTDNSFAELFVQVIETRSGNRVRCQDFVDGEVKITDNNDFSTNPSHSLDIHYVIYWNSNSKRSTSYFRKKGHFYAY